MAHPAQTALWLALTLQPAPHHAQSTVKRMRREKPPGGGGWGVEGVFNWIIPSAVITLLLSMPSSPQPLWSHVKETFIEIEKGGADKTHLAWFIPALICHPPMFMSTGEFMKWHLLYKFYGNFHQIIFMLNLFFQISNSNFFWHHRLFILLCLWRLVCDPNIRMPRMCDIQPFSNTVQKNKRNTKRNYWNHCKRDLCFLQIKLLK